MAKPIAKSIKKALKIFSRQSDNRNPSIVPIGALKALGKVNQDNEKYGFSDALKSLGKAWLSHRFKRWKKSDSDDETYEFYRLKAFGKVKTLTIGNMTFSDALKCWKKSVPDIKKCGFPGLFKTVRKS